MINQCRYIEDSGIFMRDDEPPRKKRYSNLEMRKTNYVIQIYTSKGKNNKP